MATLCCDLLSLCQYRGGGWGQLLSHGFGWVSLLGKACVPPALVENLEEAPWTLLSSSVSANVSVFPDGFAGAQHLWNLTGMW